MLGLLCAMTGIAYEKVTHFLQNVNATVMESVLSQYSEVICEQSRRVREKLDLRYRLEENKAGECAINVSSFVTLLCDTLWVGHFFF